ncbi:hypothetical protein EVG20_g11071 [Dentipellis fragilis]|uniref:Uncharacterized protein n=1 Tax=Dentipellis fragilis TaxID=205917 RepID=A0A4Y9XLW7_9AGAM|nr:hypothetical protein EVG20_g11071 [Dentipellis fragilis]
MLCSTSSPTTTITSSAHAPQQEHAASALVPARRARPADRRSHACQNRPFLAHRLGFVEKKLGHQHSRGCRQISRRINAPVLVVGVCKILKFTVGSGARQDCSNRRLPAGALIARERAWRVVDLIQPGVSELTPAREYEWGVERDEELEDYEEKRRRTARLMTFKIVSVFEGVSNSDASSCLCRVLLSPRCNSPHRQRKPVYISCKNILLGEFILYFGPCHFFGAPFGRSIDCFAASFASEATRGHSSRAAEGTARQRYVHAIISTTPRAHPLPPPLHLPLLPAALARAPACATHRPYPV